MPPSRTSALKRKRDTSLIELTLMLTTKPTSERALPTADPESSWENSSVETAGIEPASAIA